MSGGRGNALAALQRRIGHDFGDPALLDTALTHGSALEGRVPPEASYQRLEFLGDRVLGLIAAEMLVKAFPKAQEGELAQRFSDLVRNETCAEVALDVDLGEAIRLGGGEAQSGGRKKAAILGDVCEAVIGALYLDGGLDAARTFIETNWKERMLGWDGPLRDAKTALQEWVQGRGLPTPVYTVIDRTGPDHAPSFTVEVTVDAIDAGRGEGRTKRDAEQLAAAAVLRREGVWKVTGSDV
jgi:ribonuclease-3